MKLRIAFLLAVCCLLALMGCQRPARSTAEVPRIFSPRYSLAVMPFTQPTNACELILGHIPEGQGCISSDQMAYLDADLRDLLRARKNGRVVAFEPASVVPHTQPMDYKSSGAPQALASWARLAKKTGKDFVLVPQVLDWRERDGSRAGVSQSASVRLEFFLIHAATGLLQNHVVYDEEQVGLANNLLTMGDFVKRKGAWISARELADEGLAIMLKELGL